MTKFSYGIVDWVGESLTADATVDDVYCFPISLHERSCCFLVLF